MQWDVFCVHRHNKENVGQQDQLRQRGRQEKKAKMRRKNKESATIVQLWLCSVD